MNWKKVQRSQSATFQLGQEPELIHIIKTGFKDQYIVVYEDGTEVNYGKTEIMNADMISAKFDIDIVEELYYA